MSSTCCGARDHCKCGKGAPGWAALMRRCALLACCQKPPRPVGLPSCIRQLCDLLYDAAWARLARQAARLPVTGQHGTNQLAKTAMTEPRHRVRLTAHTLLTHAAGLQHAINVLLAPAGLQQRRATCLTLAWTADSCGLAAAVWTASFIWLAASMMLQQM